MSDYPQYFDLNHVPARVLGRLKLPEIYRGGGRWEKYTDHFALMHSRRISQRQFDELIASFDAERAQSRKTP